MPTPVPYIVAGAAFVLLARFLLKRKMVLSFLLNAVLGVLFCVGGVCIAPLLGFRFSLNLFTGTVCTLLGPPGAVGLLLLSVFWNI